MQMHIPTFTERYSWEDFQLVEDIRKILTMVRDNRFSGNYQPYQVRTKNALYQQFVSVPQANDFIDIDLNVRTLKLEYAIQVWEIAQSLVRRKFPIYLRNRWEKQKDSPIKKFTFIDSNRAEATTYFLEMLQQVCASKRVVVSEFSALKRYDSPDFDANQLEMNVLVNQAQLSEEFIHTLTHKIYQGEDLGLQPKNYSFSFEEIQDYFVFCDEKLLGLLNAIDENKFIPEKLQTFFKCAVDGDFDGLQTLLSAGVPINSIDRDGETALTKVVKRFNDYFQANDDEKKIEELRAETMKMMETLLTNGADVNLFGFKGLNALQYAAFSHQPELIKILLEHGANPNFNYFPEEGEEQVKSTPLFTLLNSIPVFEEEIAETNACIQLLRDAGAIG